MAFVDVPVFEIPVLPDCGTGALSLGTNLLLDAAGEKGACIIQAPNKSGLTNIRKIYFRLGSVTTATDLDVRVESVDLATGDPTGNLLNANSNAVLPAASVIANTARVVTLTADAIVTPGKNIAIVFAPAGIPNMRVNTLGAANGLHRFPYCDLFTAAWAKNALFMPMIGIEYSDGSSAYIPDTWPASGVNSHVINTGTTPNEIALRFRLAYAARVIGFWLWADLDGNADVILYDSNGSTVLTSVDIDPDLRVLTTNGLPHRVLFPAAVELSADTTYFLAVKPTTGTSLTVYSMDAHTAALLDQMSGGQAFHYRQATNDVWDAAITTRRPMLGLMVDGIDTAGGGGAAHPVIHSE